MLTENLSFEEKHKRKFIENVYNPTVDVPEVVSYTAYGINNYDVTINICGADCSCLYK